MQRTLEERTTKFLAALDTAEEECFKARDESLKRIISIKKGLVSLKQLIPGKVIAELEVNARASNPSFTTLMSAGIIAAHMEQEDVIQYLHVLKYKSFLMELETHRLALRTYDKVLSMLFRLNH